MKVLVTGVAGFIGMHTALRLLERGDEVIGVDNLCDYYDVKLKKNRLKEIENSTNSQQFIFHRTDISESESLQKVFKEHKPEKVINLAAQPGVRYSIENPMSYIQTNIVGFANILECCRHHAVKHLVYASSSSVYGSNTSMPYSTQDNVDHPLSLYAASKKSNELMAHSYSHLYDLPTTGLRFFTVYGPWGRPDMSPMLFADAISREEKIKVFNYGNHSRDFTYIDDIANGVVSAVNTIPAKNPGWERKRADPATSHAPWKVYNIGNQKKIALLDYIKTIEKHMDKKAILELLPLQAGDVEETWADSQPLIDEIGYSPITDLDSGIRTFVDWYKDYCKSFG